MNLALTLEHRLLTRQEIYQRLELRIRNEQTRNVVFLMHCGWDFCMSLRQRWCAVSRRWLRRWWYLAKDGVRSMLKVSRVSAVQLLDYWVEPSEVIGTETRYRLREVIA